MPYIYTGTANLYIMGKFIKVTDNHQNEIVLNTDYIIQFYPSDESRVGKSTILTTVQNIQANESVDEIINLINSKAPL